MECCAKRVPRGFRLKPKNQGNVPARATLSNPEGLALWDEPTAPAATPGAVARIPVLLASASYGGTIAAVRCLGANGFQVSVVSRHLGLCAAAWSRYVYRSHRAPAETSNDPFVDRLLSIGAQEPGQLLLPTSDETTWLYAERAADLGSCYRLYQPPIAVIRRILDKKLLAEAAIEAGLTVLPSWHPSTVADVARLAPSLPYPVLIKRSTHVHHAVNHKGVVVRAAGDLVREYESYLRQESVRCTGVSPLPFLQRLVNVEEAGGVCSVSGFIDRTGELFVTRRCRKVLQRSQPVGVGVCFEPLPEDPELSDGVRRFCRALGYFGIFEAEFVRFDDAWALIDFNPRLYNQLGMDIRRGMPLPLLACLDAAGETAALRAAVERAQILTDDDQAVFCDGFTLHAILLARRLTGRISTQELAQWRRWIRGHAGHTVDAAIDPADRVPAVVHALSELWLGLRAVPKFLRLTPRVSAGKGPSAAERS